jgi:hypothetical protein
MASSSISAGDVLLDRLLGALLGLLRGHGRLFSGVIGLRSRGFDLLDLVGGSRILGLLDSLGRGLRLFLGLRFIDRLGCGLGLRLLEHFLGSRLVGHGLLNARFFGSRLLDCRFLHGRFLDGRFLFSSRFLGGRLLSGRLFSSRLFGGRFFGGRLVDHGLFRRRFFRLVGGRRLFRLLDDGAAFGQDRLIGLGVIVQDRATLRDAKRLNADHRQRTGI